MKRKFRKFIAMLLVSSLFISNIEPFTVQASGSDGVAMDTDELVFITLADNPDYRWNANGNGDQGNVIHLDTVKGSNCKFKLKKVVDKDGNVSNDDTNYYGIKFIRDAGTDRFADIEDKSKDDGKKLHLWESDDNKVKGNEHRQFAFYSAGPDSYGNECYYIQNRNSGLWLGVEDTNESGKCDKGDKIIQTSESNREQWIISKAVVPKCGDEAEDIIADGQESASVEIFKKDSLSAINRVNDAACKGTQLHLYDVGTSSKWRIDWDATYSAYTIHAVTGGEKDRGSAFTDGGVVWDVSGEDGEKVHLWDEQSKSENQNTSQFWRFIKQSDGSYKIQNAKNGLYLSLKGTEPNQYFVLSDEGMDFEISAFADQKTPLDEVNFAYATEWMKDIPDDVSLSSVNIPGTHDTGTASIWEDDWAQFSWTSCQKLYYGEQLNVGARSFDIRCNATKDDASPSDVMIIHGGEKPQCYNRDDSNLTLKDILDDSVRFLEEHSSEALIMTVKQDAGSASGLVHAMSEFIKAHKDYVYTGNGIPSMGEARGKIVFMRRYAIDEKVYDPADDGVEKSWLGLDLTNWDNFNYMKNTYALNIYDKDNVSVFVQDAFKADAYDEKRDYIEGTMKQTVGENKDAPKIPADAWVYNYVSTAGIGGIEPPLTQTRGINPWLYEDEINCIDNRRLGMVMMNYIDAPMARLIYETNFKDGNFFATKTTLPTTVTVTCGQRLGEAKITGSYPYGGKWRFDEEGYIPTWEDFNNGKKFSMTYYSDKEKRRSQTAEVAITDFVKNDIDVTVDSKEITYGDTTPKLTFTCNEGNLQGEDTTEALKITLSIEPKATGKDGRLKAGTWKIQAVSDSENYNVSFTEGTIKVNPKTVNATWSDTTNLKYNGESQNVTADLTGVLEGDDCTPVVTGGDAVGPSWSEEVGDKPEKYTANLSLTGEDAGNYQLAEGCESKSYYILREQPREGEYQFPEKAVLTYGQTLSEATLIGASGAGKFVFVDKVSKEGIGDTKPTAAGTYESEYYLAFVPENNEGGMVVNDDPTTVEVQQKEIKIIINDNDRVYGRSLYPFSYSFKIAEGYSLADGDTETSLGITLSAGEGDGLSVNAGTYPITVQSCSNTNYKVTAVPGTLTVLKRPIRLSWNNEFTYSYTGNPVDITCAVASVNVQFGEYEGSPCTFRVLCNQKVEVGYYTAFAIITNANYTYDSGNALDNGCYYEIVKADPDVTFPSEISLTYGQTLSQAEFTGADSKGIPGEFKIKEETSDSSLLTPSDSGTELEVQFVPQDTKNYNVISKKIPLKVSKKTIVVRAEDQKQIYGDEIAEFAWSMDESQLVGDDKKEDFAFTLTAKKGGSDVIYVYPAAGLYEISISCDEEKSNLETIQKYTFDFRQGSLEISPRVAEIQWSDTTCIVKDGSGPSATIANLVGPDECTVTVESDGTEIESYDAATDTWTPYTAKITGLSGANKFNYCLSANEEDLEVSYYVLASEEDYVMPKEAYLTYGQKPSEVKWGAMAGKGDFRIVDRQTHFYVEDNKILSAGEHNDYAVWFYPAGSEGLESDMVYSDITLYVEKKELTVNALPAEKTYGEETKLDFTVDASKLVGEDTKADLGVVLTAIGTSGSEEEKIDGNRINSPVGTYDITMAQCNSENYDVTVVSSMLTIQPKEVSLSWSDVSNLVYSGNPVNVTAKAEGILEGDTCEVKVSNGQKIGAGTYQAIAVSLSNNNYKLSSEFSECVKEYTIKEASSTPGLPNNTMEVDYGKKKVSDVTLPEGWAWQDEDKDKALTVGTAVKATAVYTGADKGNYETESVEISITRAECTHATTEVKDAKDATCTEKGYTGDTYCKVCGEKVETSQDINALGHDMTKTVSAEVKATCTTDGKEAVKGCSRCDYTEGGEKINALGHNFSAEFTVDKEATCAEAGSKSKHCSRCDAKSEVTEIPVDKTKHGKTEIKDVKDATCTEKGYSGDTYCKVCGEKVETGQDINALGHDMTKTVFAEVKATCTEAGKEAVKGCSRCDYTEGGAVIDALGHDMIKEISAKVEATCTTDGKEAVKGCSRCDYTEGGEKINALGHNFSAEFTVDKEATCAEAGSKSKHCSRCDEVTDVTPIPKKEHTWDSGTVTKPATCTEKGVKSYKCTVDGCDGAKTEDIEALGHDYASEFTVDKEATCAEAGSKSKHCSRCDEVTEVTPIEKLTTHSYVNGVCSVCDDIFKTTVDGVTYQVMTETGADGKPLGKLVTVSGNEIPQVAVAVTGTGDDFAVSDGKVTVPSEITGSGSEQTFVVTKIAEDAFSDASVTEIVIPATVTEVGTGAFGIASTITFKGNTAPSGIAGAITETVTTVNVPEGAADSYREELDENANIVEVHTHTFDTKWTYDETYHWHVATCEHAEEVSDKAEHTFGEWVTVTEATEDAEGVKERSCSCGYKETDKIDKLAHTIHVKDEGTRVEPTCEKKGSITYKCTKCGEVMEVVELDATGHKWDAGKVTKEATETAEGVKTYTCSVCGKTKTEAIPKKTATTQEPPKKGDVVADDKASVTVEVTDVAKKEVEYKEPANKKAKTVSIPATVKINGVTYKVTKIADNAFKNNKTVIKVTVGSNIKTIGKNAFYKCTKLKTVKIGKNVTKIGANAFNGCKKLKTIKITSTKLSSKTVSKNAFKGLTKATTIKVPKKKLSAYKKLFKQKGLSSKVKVKGY